MIPAAAIEAYRAVQVRAKTVSQQLVEQITPDDTEASLVVKAKTLLAASGLTETWYYDCPVMVLLGSRSCRSESGRSYIPAREPVGEHNVITLDLSPSYRRVWGDCARTIFMEHGRATLTPQTPEFLHGLQVLRHLHLAMCRFVEPATQFGELYEYANHQIMAAGYENLDFLGNVGHSIAQKREERLFIEAYNTARLEEAPFFTFEPHIRRVGGHWGFKYENIYYFDQQGHAIEL
ncbi:Xaa-Pro aminopeptidase [Chitinivorax tropicus]|uniref:Xaa-Pro aminopeptidase n=1 Tax=Chitinivorax tropicus TaxID=714531 RepID=A0A840MP80_9PROT|nr:M24 family metallopeptidase [Chitinivorax tropicus]MBB5018552.1 Xaa-Pro aminopeptidase [Chitinivorax tropicus]